MKTLVLAEKPSVGKDIARALACGGGGNGFMESGKYVVTWALGHLVTLADPEKYSERYKHWNMDDLPIMPKRLELTVIRESARQYSVVKELLGRKDVGEIVIATDAGREGELVARWILEKAGCHKPLKRLWISSVTDKAIKEGFRRLKDGRETAKLAESARARAEADWLVGINATRALTTKYNSQLSCGRVQTPTVAIIASREEEIRGFKPQSYYGLTARTESFTLTWRDSAGGGTRSFDRDRAQKLLSGLKPLTKGVVKNVDRQAKKEYPPKLYDLTELQRDANQRYGFSPKETLGLAQRLYEQHKALTYPRTDSRYLSSDIVPTLGERLRAMSAPPYGKTCIRLLAKPIPANAGFVDDKKVTDHHAIIPTEQSVDLRDLNDRERKIYDLVVTRFLAVLLPPCEYEQTTVTVDIGGERFTACGRVVLKPGFREMYTHVAEDEDEAGEEDAPLEQALPALKTGESIAIKAVAMTEGRTKPPAPFNEATLLSAMENPAKYMENTEAGRAGLAKTLGETGGLGTVATRADVIEKLYDTFYIEKRGKDLHTTSKGRQLLKLAPEDLRSPALTGRWEQTLSKIAAGQADKDAFLEEIRQYTTTIVSQIKASAETFRHDNLSTTRCPECGKFMLEVNGKKGKLLVCQDRECNTRKSLSVVTNARCPECHKRLEIVGDGPKRNVVCACGRRESYEAFEKRMARERDKASKQDVRAYMDKMKTRDDKPAVNPAIAEALKDLLK